MQSGEATGGLIAYQSSIYVWNNDMLDLENRMTQDLLDFLVRLLGDVVYFNKAIKESESEKFIYATAKEVDMHTQTEHCVVIPRDEVT